MALRLGFEDRGFGRAYVVVEADGPEGSSLAASAAGPGGEALPVSVVRAPRKGVAVLVAPLMTFDYEVRLDALDGDGAVLESATHVVLAGGPPEQEAPRSQLVATGLDDIRYIDLHPTPDAVWVSPERAIDFEDGTDVVHAEVVALFPGDLEPGEPRLTLLGLDGHRIDARPTVVLEHEVEPAAAHLALHRLRLSFHIPRELEALVVGVEWGPSNGFCVAEPWLLGKLRGEWWDITHADAIKGDYHRWFLDKGRTDDRTLHLQARTPVGDGPLFSIVVPVFRTPLDYLEAMVASVRAQTYPRWELLLVNASPEDRELAAALVGAKLADGRIRVLPLEGNQGIALNTRAGIDAARGDYVCFLDHDDFLEPDALFEYATAIREDPGADLLYSDEDLFIDGRYGQGYLKPDPSPRMLLNRNYVTHFLCVSRRALDRLREGRGLPGREFDGAQDYALTLLVLAQGGRFHHVRRVLYHWRAHPGSTSVSLDAKAWTDDAGRRALEAYLEEVGIAARVEPGIERNLYDVVYQVGDEGLVSVVVTRTMDDCRYLDCVASVLERTTYRDVEVLVANPFGPIVPPPEWEGRVREVAVPRRASIPRTRNAGAADARGRYLAFLDDRCRVGSEDWLQRLLGPLGHPDVAVVGAGLVYADGLVRHVGICLPKGQPRFVGHHVPAQADDPDYYRRLSLFTRDVTAVSGSALLIGAERFRGAGGFDEDYQRGFDDVDLCLRLGEEGLATVVVPRARLTYAGFSPDGRVLPFSYFGQPAAARSLGECLAIKHDEGLFRKRWSRFWGQGDPLYNPQLAKESCHYQIVRW